MTDKATLLELAERCEKATRPDRELIALIANAVDLQAADLICNRLPDYTASLDAAMTLVPEGWKWATGSSGPACAWRTADDNIIARGKTPALALTAAALRARAAMIGEPS